MSAGLFLQMKKRLICADNLTPVVNPGCKLLWRISGHHQPPRMRAEESHHISNIQLSQTGFIIRQMLDSGFNVLMLHSCNVSQGDHGSMGLQIKMHLKHFSWHSQNMQQATSKINSQNGIKAFMSPRQTCVASNQTVSYNHLFSSLVT